MNYLVEKGSRVDSKCLVVMYHYVRNPEPKFNSLKALQIDDFEKQLDFLASNYEMIDYSTFLAGLVNKKYFQNRCCLLTFDDGFKDHYTTVLSRLLSRKLRALFFVASAPLIDKRVLKVHQIHFLMAYMGSKKFTEMFYDRLNSSSGKSDFDRKTGKERQQQVYRYDDNDIYSVKYFLNYDLPYRIRDAILEKMFYQILGDEQDFANKLYLSEDNLQERSQSGMTIGGHGHSHKVLSRISTTEVKRDLGRCFGFVTRLLGKSEIPFCYPYGQELTYNDNIISILKEIGYRLSFTAVREEVSFLTHDLFALPRFDTADLYPFTRK